MLILYHRIKQLDFINDPGFQLNVPPRTLNFIKRGFIFADRFFKLTIVFAFKSSVEQTD